MVCIKGYVFVLDLEFSFSISDNKTDVISQTLF